VDRPLHQTVVDLAVGHAALPSPSMAASSEHPDRIDRGSYRRGTDKAGAYNGGR
jgi:hypothetical protein